ncbi:hypothetical protein V6N13_143802 [Hibiscus sabdariffa]
MNSRVSHVCTVQIIHIVCRHCMYHDRVPHTTCNYSSPGGTWVKEDVFARTCSDIWQVVRRRIKGSRGRDAADDVAHQKPLEGWKNGLWIYGLVDWSLQVGGLAAAVAVRSVASDCDKVAMADELQIRLGNVVGLGCASEFGLQIAVKDSYELYQIQMEEFKSKMPPELLGLARDVTAC